MSDETNATIDEIMLLTDPADREEQWAAIAAALAAKDAEAAQIRRALAAFVEHVERQNQMSQHNPYTARELHPRLFALADAAMATKDAALKARLAEPAKPEPGEWIEWAGGECPIADGVRHQIRTRDGWASTVGADASGWDWALQGGDIAIVAYRVLA